MIHRVEGGEVQGVPSRFLNKCFIVASSARPGSTLVSGAKWFASDNTSINLSHQPFSNTTLGKLKSISLADEGC